jgi:endoglucanase
MRVHDFQQLLTDQTLHLLAGVFLAVGAFGQTGYLHTNGNQILDSQNHIFRIAGVNWYGLETTDEVPHGLWAQDYHSVLNAIRSNGYNTIRIPFSNQMVETPIVPSNINFGSGKNSDLIGLNSLQILDKIVAAAGSVGLRVILDNHRSEAGNSAEASGQWYTGQYPETNWINDWTMLARRYANDSTVIGMDLRNEPHNAVCWGCGSLTTDWRLAAQRAGNAVLAVNPNVLIFVEGIDCYNGDCDWWGGNLEGAQSFPVVLNVPGRLVYSAHDYGPNLYRQNWFNGSTTPASLGAVWTKYWAYLSINNVAPVWVGEFGTTNTASDVQNTAAGSQGQWFSSLVNFLHSNPAIQWTYWALNGEDSYAVLDGNYDPTPASALKQQLLGTIQTPGTGGSGVGCSTAPGVPVSLGASGVSASQINLFWGGVSAPAGCSVTYNVYASRTPGFSPGPSTRIAFGLAGTSFQSTGLLASTTYYYFVTASDSTGESTASNEAIASTSAPACNNTPSLPGNLIASAVSSTQINLTWNGVTPLNGCTLSYNVYRGTTSGFAPSAANRIGTVGGTSYSALNLTPSTTYYFVVRATDLAGESGNSNQATAQTQGTAPVPGGGNSSCHVTYVVNTQWPGGFNVSMTIQNTGHSSMNGWTLTWTWPSTQHLAGVWNATGTQQGQNVSFANAPWNSIIAPGATAAGVGFNGTFSSTNPAPSAFFLNGVRCQ